MTRRRGHRPTPQPARTQPGTPPTGPAGASPATTPALPAGPAIVYISPAGEHTPIDQTAVTDPRDRALCRALIDRTAAVLTEAETTTSKNPVGFTA